MKVRKNHPYDGTKNAGKPVGEVLDVILAKPHQPIDGPRSQDTICQLSDGSWEFLHNLTIIDAKPRLLETLGFGD